MNTLKTKLLLTAAVILSPLDLAYANEKTNDINLTAEEIELYANTDFEDFSKLDIFSASKRPEKVKDVAGSVYVLSSKDIMKAGITSIPEALRMVPGVQVARTTSNSWAISIRGFNRQFSNKLLVLMDGRTLYTPLFTGVYWDIQDYPIEDIERIEVIRGPGGTLWGANAVNGIINIITKEARKTQGNYASITGGTHEQITEARTGGKFKNINFYRVYGSYRENSDFKRVESERSNDDNWRKGQAGFRSEMLSYGEGKITLQGDFYTGRRELDLQMPTSSSPFISNVDLKEDYSGGNVLLKWNVPIGDVQTTLQTYVDYAYRDILPILEHEIITYDFDWQANYDYGRHAFTAGIGNRIINDNLNNSSHLIYSPESTSQNIFNTFIQDKISLVTDKLYLILGSKFDYNDYTNFEIQPNARLLWHINQNHTVWTAISRAVRTPSRGEDSFSRFYPAGFTYGAAYTQGSSSYESENLNAYEAGWRGNLNKNLYVEVNTFYNDYSDLRTIDVVSVGPTVLRLQNFGFGETYGAETLAIWGVNKDWDLKFGYSILKQNFHKHKGSTDTGLERDEQRSPSFQYSITSDYDITDKISMNNSLYFVDDISYFSTVSNVTSKKYIENYTRFDTTITYKASKNLELSVIGQNLFDDYHQEFDEIIYSTPSEIPRMFYAQVKYKF